MGDRQQISPDHNKTGGLKNVIRAVAPGYCGQKRTRGDSTCKNPAGYRTDHPGWGHCDLHGGNTPSKKEYAAKQRTEIMARRSVLELGASITTTPEKALSDEINRSAGMVGWIQQQIQQWEIGEDGKIAVTHITENGEVIEIRVPALVGILAHPMSAKIMEAYRDERAHLARVAKMGADARIADRMTALDEKRLDLMDDLIRAVITDLGHDPNDNRVRAIVSKRLMQRAVS